MNVFLTASLPFYVSLYNSLYKAKLNSIEKIPDVYIKIVVEFLNRLNFTNRTWKIEWSIKTIMTSNYNKL